MARVYVIFCEHKDSIKYLVARIYVRFCEHKDSIKYLVACIYVIFYDMLWLCVIRYWQVMYVNYKRYVQYTNARLIRTLCRKKIRGMTCIINLCHDLKLWNLVYFMCHMHQNSSKSHYNLTLFFISKFHNFGVKRKDWKAIYSFTIKMSFLFIYLRLMYMKSRG